MAVNNGYLAAVIYSDGETGTVFPVSWPRINDRHIRVFFDSEELILDIDFIVDSTNITLLTHVVDTDNQLIIMRFTPREDRAIIWSDGTPFVKAALDKEGLNIHYINQELFDWIGLSSTGIGSVCPTPLSTRDTGNLVWAGSLNVWQLSTSFTDFTVRADVVDGYSFATSVSSDDVVLVTQAAQGAQMFRLTSDTDEWCLVCPMTKQETDAIRGRVVYVQSGVRGNALTGVVSVRVQYTTYPDRQRITRLDGKYDVGHTEVSTTVITPTEGSALSQSTVEVVIPYNAVQVAICYTYVPVGAMAVREWLTLGEMSITLEPYENIPKVTFEDAYRLAQGRIKKSYPYSVNTRSVGLRGALRDTSLGLDTLTDSELHCECSSMIYPPTVTIRDPAGGGVGATFANITQGTSLTPIVTEISSTGFVMSTAIKALAYEQRTFVPALIGATVTHTRQVGDLVKVGNMVDFTLELDYTGLDTADTSDFQLSGLTEDTHALGVGDISINPVLSTGLSLLTNDSLHAIIHPTSLNVLSIARSGSANKIYDYNDLKLNAAGSIYMSGRFRTTEKYRMNTYAAHYELRATM